MVSDACDGLHRRHGFQHHRPGRDTRAMAHFDVAKHFRARPDQHAVADFRVAVFLFLACPAKRHGMQHGNVVADDGRLTDDNGMGVVDHDPLPHLRARMDIDAEHLGDAHLDEVGQVPSPRPPQPMPDAIRCDGLEALEIHQRLQEPVTGRVAVKDGDDIGTHLRTEDRIRGKRLIRDLAQQLLGHLGGCQLLRHAIGERVFQCGVVEHAGMDQTAEQWLVGDGA